MRDEPGELEVVVEAPHRDGVRYAFDAIDVRCRVTGPAAVTSVEARVGDLRTNLERHREPDGETFAGRVPTTGLPRGAQPITVVAHDAAGREATAHAAVDVQPFDPLPPGFDGWAALVADGHPIVHREGHLLGTPRPGWPAPHVVTGFAFCTQGLARLSLIVDGRHEAVPFHGLYRPDVDTVLGIRAGAGAGFRGELLALDGAPRERELVVLAVAPDGRAAGWRGALPAATAPASAPSVVSPLPPLQPPPRLRDHDGGSLAGMPPRGRHRWRRLAEAWAERALSLEGEREAAETDVAWSGLQTRLALERAAEQELARRAARSRAAALRFPAVERPVVSIVVPVHHGADLTERCLRALVRAGGDVPFEVVVVDDGDDPAVTVLLDTVEGARVVRNVEPLGYLRSANRGAQAARGTHIAHLNNDTEPQPGWLDALVRRLEEADDVGVVVAKLLFPDGRLQEAGSIVWSDGQGWNYGSGEDETAPAYNVVREVDYGSAAAMLVRGSLWRELGGFDVRFRPAYYEDVDLCFAARERGLRVLYEPASRVVHVQGGSMGAGGLGVSRDLIEANRLTFRRKWGTALAEHRAFHPDAVEAAAGRIRRV